MSRCRSSSDCNFFQTCVEHSTGICLGTCTLATWANYFITWSVIGALLAFLVCVRCEFCFLHKKLCGHNGDGAGPPGAAPGTGRRLTGPPDLSRQVSEAPSAAGRSRAPSGNPAGGGGGGGMSSFHSVVMARAMSYDATA